jgi:hypothetical protein
MLLQQFCNGAQVLGWGAARLQQLDCSPPTPTPHIPWRSASAVPPCLGPASGTPGGQGMCSVLLTVSATHALNVSIKNKFGLQYWCWVSTELTCILMLNFGWVDSFPYSADRSNARPLCPALQRLCRAVTRQHQRPVNLHVEVSVRSNPMREVVHVTTAASAQVSGHKSLMCEVHACRYSWCPNSTCYCSCRLWMHVSCFAHVLQTQSCCGAYVRLRQHAWGARNGTDVKTSLP